MNFFRSISSANSPPANNGIIYEASYTQSQISPVSSLPADSHTVINGVFMANRTYRVCFLSSDLFPQESTMQTTAFFRRLLPPNHDFSQQISPGIPHTANDGRLRGSGDAGSKRMSSDGIWERRALNRCERKSGGWGDGA